MSGHTEYKRLQETDLEEGLVAVELQGRDINGKTVAVPFDSSGENIISKTFTELKGLATANKLVKGQKYRITDYMTTYTQPVTNATKSSGIVEVLQLTAITTNSFATECNSELYPQDIVYYDINGATEGFTKGKIFRRIDKLRNNDIGTDWRHVKYDRSGVDKLLFEDYTGCINNVIKTYFLFNSVAGNYFHSNTIGGNFHSNTIGNYFSSNTIGGNFRSNTIGGNFRSNTIGGNFSSNTIGDYFSSNTIGDYFSSNTIGDNFSSNTIGGNFKSNTIGYSFFANTIFDYVLSKNFTENYKNRTVYGNVKVFPTNTSAEKMLVIDPITKELSEKLIPTPQTTRPLLNTNFNTNDLIDGLPQYGREINLQNTSNIEITVKAGTFSTYFKGGVGAIKFVADTGRTLKLMDATDIIDGIVGSYAKVKSFGTVDYIYINNY